MRTILVFLLVVAAAPLARADVVECDNGDRYNGKVLSMDDKSVKLQNEIAGTLTIPRSRIVGISLRPGAAPPIAAKPATTRTNPPAPLNPNKIQFDAASIQRIQNEYLATATPEAQQMFQDMISGLESGRLNTGHIREQAVTALKELREAQRDLGDADVSGILDSYASILEKFIGQTPPPAVRPGQAPPRAR